MTDAPATLRVATFNVRAGIGPGEFPDRWWHRIDRARLRRIGDLIIAMDADLVALQEVEIPTRGLEATDCRVVTEAGDASDHWPVLATVEIR